MCRGSSILTLASWLKTPSGERRARGFEVVFVCLKEDCILLYMILVILPWGMISRYLGTMENVKRIISFHITVILLQF